uniref:G domain-containing protein n=1 Tax=Fagus sylvatica TaxID=28930 RepID=A0A2N9HSR0_FAGSY
MGGDTITPPPSVPEEDSFSLEQDSTLFGDNISMKSEHGTMIENNEMVFGEFNEVGGGFSSTALDFEAGRRRRHSAYREVLQSYDKLQIRSEHLKEAKSKILRYTPGAWIEKVGGMQLADYDVPKTTSLLLIGPKGSGKSSLVNRISKVFEEDEFASERAQVSYTSVGDGTYFLQEYMIPKSSTSFCLYDTRSLSDDSSDNAEMLKRWMTKGVRHGDPISRDSDSPSLRASIKCKARWNHFLSSEIRRVNFIIFVINGISVLKSMDSNDDSETKYIQTLVTAFNCPYLSFKDDKPVVVVTHGDLLSLSDRARIRVHLGELLGIPPAKQIFDIAESCDPVTELTIIDMLCFCLEHADTNLPLQQ